MEMEIVYPPKKLLSLPLQKFADQGTLQTQMGIAYTLNKPPHQQHILAQLDLSLTETEDVFKKELLIKLQLIKYVDLDIQAMDKETVSQLILKPLHLLLIILVKQVIFLMEMEDVF